VSDASEGLLVAGYGAPSSATESDASSSSGSGKSFQRPVSFLLFVPTLQSSPPASLNNLLGGSVATSVIIFERTSSVRRGLHPAPGRSPSLSSPSAPYSDGCAHERFADDILLQRRSAWCAIHPTADDHPSAHFPVAGWAAAVGELADLLLLGKIAWRAESSLSMVASFGSRHIRTPIMPQIYAGIKERSTRL